MGKKVYAMPNIQGNNVGTEKTLISSLFGSVFKTLVRLLSFYVVGADEIIKLDTDQTKSELNQIEQFDSILQKNKNNNK